MPKQFTKEQIREMAEWHRGVRRGTWEWELRRFILPRLCYSTNKWSGWFPQMCVGTRIPHPNDPSPLQRTYKVETWLILPEVFIMKKLKGEKIVF